MKPLPSLIVTPHPVTLDGQRTMAAELRAGENLGAFLARTVPDYGSDVWEVRINGVVVPHEVMHRVRPKGGTVVEVRGVVGKTALLIVAMIALTIFTAGVGTAMVAAGYSAMAAGMAQAAIYAVGSLLINKVLGPKPPKPTESDAAAVFTLGGSRNQARPYEPLALLLGSVRIAPDLGQQSIQLVRSQRPVHGHADGPRHQRGTRRRAVQRRRPAFGLRGRAGLAQRVPGHARAADPAVQQR
ncbi:hypothetical protein V8017_00060 [Stenotrophomonas rhizophila]